MIARPEALEKLLTVLRTLPSVGPKMAERVAMHILRSPEEKVKELAHAILETYQRVRPCPVCGYWDDRSPCRICQDPARDASVICIVETPQDVAAMSRVNGFRGVYHVLGGALSPLEGVGPQDLRIAPLLKRLQEGAVKEVVLALNPDVEGESTSQFLAKQIDSVSKRLEAENPASKIKVTRLAQGVPAGGELEYMDELTLARALEGRRDVI